MPGKTDSTPRTRPTPRPALTARQKFARAREDALGSVAVCMLFLAFALRVAFLPLLSWLAIAAAVLVLVPPFKQGVRQWKAGERAAYRTFAVLAIPPVLVFAFFWVYG